MYIDDGFIELEHLAAASVPNPPAGKLKLFFDLSNSDHFSQKDSSGTVVDLAATSGGAPSNDNARAVFLTNYGVF